MTCTQADAARAVAAAHLDTHALQHVALGAVQPVGAHELRLKGEEVSRVVRLHRSRGQQALAVGARVVEGHFAAGRKAARRGDDDGLALCTSGHSAMHAMLSCAALDAKRYSRSLARPKREHGRGDRCRLRTQAGKWYARGTSMDCTLKSVRVVTTKMRGSEERTGVKVDVAAVAVASAAHH